jgi:enamine deaminase RidA (YjgF/YER057c/UK114 family)
MARRLISSGSRWEGPYGYSRAVVDADRCWVAGTTDPSGDHPGDPAAQARAAFDIVTRALEEAGFELADVVRTRMYVTEAAHAAPVASVHGEVFGEVRPASTIVVVTALVEPGLLVEVEADAVRR